MTVLRCKSTYDLGRIPSQLAFRQSKAKIRGYGGAMGGGKSRALCEEVFDWVLEYPGIVVPIFRQLHTAIVDSTRKTFMEQVLPPEIRGRKDLIRTKQSQGFDFVEFWNGSVVHFVGLDNPGKWFSTEIGAACFDEAHEIQEEAVLTINSRLRQRCARCVAGGVDDCAHMPHRMILTFNPSFPGHWLQQWFILGAERNEFGWSKRDLVGTESDFPIGDAEFFVAKASDNPFLPPKYIEQSLGGLKTLLRRRYLDGLWEHVSGEGFFDQGALSALTLAAMENPPLFVGEARGDVTGDPDGKKPALVEHRGGRLFVYAAPVRWHVSEAGDEVKAHRYVVAVDASSGASADYSGIQVIDVDAFAQVAEWQGKCDPDKLAEAAFLVAAVYNGAMVAPEITGGWGFAVVKKIQQLAGGWKGPAASKPRLYTRPVVDRLSNRFTDLLGWDTNTKSRSHMLAVLEESLRDGSLEVRGERTLAELAAFAFPKRQEGQDYRSPRAQQGAHDDLVISLAIGVAVAERLPRKQTVLPQREWEPQSSVTGY